MDAQSLAIGAFSLVSGLGMLALPRHGRLAAEAKVRSRKAELAAGATERYFEERRSLEAYPLAATDRRWRVKGLVFTVVGITLLASALFR